MPRVDYIKRLARDLRAYQKAGITDLQVLLSFMTDCYLAVRPELNAPDTHCADRGRVQFRGPDQRRAPPRSPISICTAETGMPSSRRSPAWTTASAGSGSRTHRCPADRIAAIKRFYDAGIYTIGQPGADGGWMPSTRWRWSRRRIGFVNLYKIGRANRLGCDHGGHGVAHLHAADARPAGAHAKRALHQGQLGGICRLATPTLCGCSSTINCPFAVSRLLRISLVS